MKIPVKGEPWPEHVWLERMPVCNKCQMYMEWRGSDGDLAYRCEVCKVVVHWDPEAEEQTKP